MYLYAASISVIQNERIYVTAVALRHVSHDSAEVEAAVLQNIALEVFPVSEGYSDHHVEIDSFPDEYVLEAAEFIRRN